MGTIVKAGAGRAGSCKKIGEGQIPLVPRPLFRSSQLTESLEQANRLQCIYSDTVECVQMVHRRVAL